MKKVYSHIQVEIKKFRLGQLNFRNFKAHMLGNWDLTLMYATVFGQFNSEMNTEIRNYCSP